MAYDDYIHEEIIGEYDTKKRLIEEFNKYKKMNYDTYMKILRLRIDKNVSEEEKNRFLKEFEILINDNSKYCRMLCWQLKRDYNYSVLDENHICDICEKDCILKK